jgi:hypothetical protein
MSHNIHAGYMQSVDSEDLTRSSNGWGSISVPGGGTNFQGTPIFYIAAYQQQGLGAVPTIHSEFRSKNIEVNDAMTIKNWTFNVGFLDSQDTLYGQGLNNADGTLSGYVLSTGTTVDSRQYKMYTVPWSKLFQPRLSATWAYDGKNTAFVSYAKFNPMASSLPRAASWDRNLATTIQSYFDANGNLFANDPLASSSGKLFVQGMTPPTHNEWIVGTAREFGQHLTGRAYFRYNRGSHYWEDTNNTARTTFNPPDTLPGTDASIPKTLYIPNLDDMRRQIGSGSLNGSSYVIAELDGAFTRHGKELTLEAEYHKRPDVRRGSARRAAITATSTRQSPTVTTSNDANIFIGSSNRRRPRTQLWTLAGSCAAIARTRSSVRLPQLALAGVPWHLHRRAVGPAVGEVDYSLYSQFTTSTVETIRLTRSRPVRGARRRTRNRSEVPAELQVRPSANRADRHRSVQRVQLADGIQLRAAGTRGGFREPAELLRSAPHPDRVQILVLTPAASCRLQEPVAGYQFVW